MHLVPVKIITAISIPSVSLLQAGCPSCRRTNSVKPLNSMSVLKGEKFVSRASPPYVEGDVVGLKPAGPLFSVTMPNLVAVISVKW